MKNICKSFGIPDEIIELLGGPPVLPRQEEEFYRLLAAFRNQWPPRDIQDWLNLWDAAAARLSINQIARAKRTVVALYGDRAVNEINRPGELRFEKIDPSDRSRATQDFDFDTGEWDDVVVDKDGAVEELARLGLPPTSVEDVAFALALPTLAQLEAMQIAKSRAERSSFDDIDARHSRSRHRDTLAATKSALENMPTADAGALMISNGPSTNSEAAE